MELTYNEITELSNLIDSYKESNETDIAINQIDKFKIIAWVETKVKNLAQPDVSGNEANPKIKQSGEVAVCFYCQSNRRVTVYGSPICQDCGNDWKQTDR